MMKKSIIFLGLFACVATTGLSSLSAAPAYAAETAGAVVTLDIMTQFIQRDGSDIDPNEALETWMKWRGERQSDNVIDLRGIPTIFHKLFNDLWDAGFRW